MDLSIGDGISQKFAHRIEDRGVLGVLGILHLADDAIEARGHSLVLEDVKDTFVALAERYILGVPSQFPDIDNQLLLVGIFLIVLTARPFTPGNSVKQGGRVPLTGREDKPGDMLLLPLAEVQHTIGIIAEGIRRFMLIGMADLAIDVQNHGIAYLKIIGIRKPLEAINIVVRLIDLYTCFVKARQEILSGRLVNPINYYVIRGGTHWNPMGLGLVISRDEGWFLMTFVR